MNMLNSIILEGNITEAGQLERNVQNILQMDISICVERFYKNRDGQSVNETSEFNVMAYGVMAEMLSRHCEKGQGVRVVGRLKQIKWTDGEKECSRVVIVAEHIEYKPKKSQKKETEDEESVF